MRIELLLLIKELNETIILFGLVHKEVYLKDANRTYLRQPIRFFCFFFRMYTVQTTWTATYYPF